MLLSVTARGPGVGRRAFKSWLHHRVAVRPQASDLSPLSHSGHIRLPAASWVQTSVSRAGGSTPGPGAWGRWAPSLGGCVPALERGLLGPHTAAARWAEAVPPEPHFPTKEGSDHGPNPQSLKLATQPGLPGLPLPVGMEAGAFPSIWAALRTSNRYGASAAVSTASSSRRRLWSWMAGVKPHRTAYNSRDLRQVTSAPCTLLDVLSVK